LIKIDYVFKIDFKKIKFKVFVIAIGS